MNKESIKNGWERFVDENKQEELTFDNGPTSGGYAFQPVPATIDDNILTINGGDDLDMLVSIQRDGTLEYGKNYNPDEAAKVFWDCLSMYSPTAELMKEIEELKAQLADATRVPNEIIGLAPPSNENIGMAGPDVRGGGAKLQFVGEPVTDRTDWVQDDWVVDEQGKAQIRDGGWEEEPNTVDVKIENVNLGSIWYNQNEQDAGMYYVDPDGKEMLLSDWAEYYDQKEGEKEVAETWDDIAKFDIDNGHWGVITTYDPLSLQEDFIFPSQCPAKG